VETCSLDSATAVSADQASLANLAPKQASTTAQAAGSALRKEKNKPLLHIRVA